jgi:hypothetical protein
MTDILDLARRATVCKGWRWLPGMLVAETDGMRPARLVGLWEEGVCPDTPGGPAWAHWGISASQEDLSGFLPDLDDPATRGCILELAREAHGDPFLCVGVCWPVDDDGPVWAAWDGVERKIVPSAASEKEALVLALEAAP